MKNQSRLLLLATLILASCATVEGSSRTPESVPTQEQIQLPSVINFLIHACVDQDNNDWCDEQDIPIGRLPVQISYLVNSTSGLVPHTVFAQTEDDGATIGSGPYPASDGFNPMGYPHVTIGDATYCFAEVYQELSPLQMKEDELSVELALIYETCKVQPPQPADQAVEG